MPDHRPTPRMRWYSEPVTRSPIFVVPGESVGSSSVVPRGKTWGIRERGDTAALRERLGVEPRRIPRDFACPVHGRFSRDAEESVEEMPCPHLETDWIEPSQWVTESALVRWNVCGLTSPWAGSTCAIGIEPGMVTG